MSCKAPAHISRCFGGVCSWCKVSPAPSPQPEPSDRKGLHIIDAQQKAVLDAMAAVPEEQLRWRAIAPQQELDDACALELARRRK